MALMTRSLTSFGFVRGCRVGLGIGAAVALASLCAAQVQTSPAEAVDVGAIRFGKAVPPVKSAGAFRLATYNAENLFDAIDDPALSGQYEDKDQAKGESQLRGLAAAITRLDADVLAIEEIESEAVLLWFRDTYLKDLGYTFARSIDAGDPRGIEQGVLSRFPIAECRNWPDLPLKGVHPGRADAPEGTPVHYHRSPLKVVVRVPETFTHGAAYDLTLMVVHQKSGRSSGYWREAEAEKTVELVGQIEREHPGANIAVLGDFNATPRDVPIQTFVGAGLVDVLAAEGEHPATHESSRAIDHIFVNANLRAELVPGSWFVLGVPARPAGVDYRTHPAPAGYASDHYPVVVDIRPVEAPNGPGGTPAKAPADTAVKPR